MESLLASLLGSALGSLAPCEPSRCPYCPDHEGRHWIKWGSYSRYAEGSSGKIDVQRYQCRFTERTFSLLPDGLLPFHFLRAAVLLAHLHALFVEDRATSAWARVTQTARTTMRGLKDRAASILRRLRLPGQAGALAPAAFLERLLSLGAESVATLFRSWKELEPKHSIVGFFPR